MEWHADVSAGNMKCFMLCRCSACLHHWGRAGAVKPQGWGAGFRPCLMLRLGVRLDHSSSSQWPLQNAAHVWPTPVISDRINQSYSNTSWHFKTKQQDISQTVSRGVSPVWPVLCCGPARGHSDGVVALSLLPAGSWGTGSLSAQPWCCGGSFPCTGHCLLLLLSASSAETLWLTEHCLF